MLNPYTPQPNAAFQSTFSSTGRKQAIRAALQQNHVHFGSRHARPSEEQTDTSQKRSWLKTLVLGAGALIGIALAGKFATTQAKGLAAKYLSTLLGEEVARNIGTKPIGDVLQTAGTGLLGKAEKWLSEGLKSDTTVDLIYGCINQNRFVQAVGAQITKDDVRAGLQSISLKHVWNEIQTHKLYSVEAIKTYLAQNTDRLSPVLGENITGLLKQLVNK